MRTIKRVEAVRQGRAPEPLRIDTDYIASDYSHGFERAAIGAIGREVRHEKDSAHPLGALTDNEASLWGEEDAELARR